MVKLNVGERLVALSLLPKEGNFVTIKLIRTLISKLSITEDEIKACDIVEANGTVKWNKKADESVEIELSEIETDIIKRELNRANEESRLTMDVISVYEKFCL